MYRENKEIMHRRAITEIVRQLSTSTTAKPGLTKEGRNMIPCLYGQAARKNETRKREKVIYTRFCTVKNKMFMPSNNLICPVF